MKAKVMNHKIKYKFKYKRKKKSVKLLKSKLPIKFFIIFLLILLYVSFYPFLKTEISPKFNITSIFEEIVSFENNLSLSKKIFENFRGINKQNKLIEENIKFKKVRNPDITVIMNIHNQAHCLYKCLRSIQNQSKKNIEIIVVDDCSTDNSTEIIKEYQKKDPRIILIEHDTNEGTIKTRTDGIRKAKGKYITIIDGDDAFIHKDILKNSFYIAQKSKIEALEFKTCIYSEGKFKQTINTYPFTDMKKIIYQPELRTKFITFNKRYHLNLRNRQICGKFIKKELFQKMLEYIGVEYTEDFIIYSEDTIMAISVFHLANSYYLMKELGYLYSFSEKGKEFPKLKNKICKVNDKLKNFDKFKFLKFLVDKTGNNYNEKLLAIKEVLPTNYDYYLNTTLDERHYKILLHIFNKILEFDILDKHQRKYINVLINRTLSKRNKEKKDNILLY